MPVEIFHTMWYSNRNCYFGGLYEITAKQTY